MCTDKNKNNTFIKLAKCNLKSEIRYPKILRSQLFTKFNFYIKIEVKSNNYLSLI